MRTTISLTSTNWSSTRFRVDSAKPSIEAYPSECYDYGMTAIRVVFDGKSFIPQAPVSLPAQSEALVLIDQADPVAQQLLDQAVRAYYQQGGDADDDAWGRATAKESHRAWDED